MKARKLFAALIGIDGPTELQDSGGTQTLSELPLDMQKEIFREAYRASLLDELSSRQANENALKNPTDYGQQVIKARQIWGGEYTDPVVSTVMDMVVESCVTFGSENLLKDVAMDDPAKEVLDHWCGNVNAGSPTLTQGLDAFREQWHLLRFRDGGCVPAWDEPTTLKTDSGISYKAPAHLAVYPRDMFKVQVGKDSFGGWRLAFTDSTTEFQSGNLSQQDYVNKQDDEFLTKERYKVCDRLRVESSRPYPVPYLCSRNLPAICANIRANKLADYNTAKRIIRAILVATKGSDAWVEKFDWSPNKDLFTQLKTALTEEGSGGINFYGGDYTTRLEWVIPRIEALLSAEKYQQENYERLAGLGILEMSGNSQRRQYIYNPKPMLIEIRNAMRHDMRFVETVLFDMIVKANPSIFKDKAKPNFFQKPVLVFLEEMEKIFLQKLWEFGILSSGEWLEMVVPGADIEATMMRREYEKAMGYDDKVMPRQTFSQTVGGRPANTIEEPSVEDVREPDEYSTASLRAVNSEQFESLKREVQETLEIDDDETRKKNRIYFLIIAAMASFGRELRGRLESYYSNQFPGLTYQMGRFSSYLNKMEAQLRRLGEDMLYGTSRHEGLYSLLKLDMGESNEKLNKIFAGLEYRLMLFEREPFRVAKISAEAARALEDNKVYAVRHSAFAPSTCQECMDLHGKIYDTDRIFDGEFDHVHGMCYFTYHETQTSAREEQGEMLSMDEINAIFKVMEKYPV